LKIYSLLSDERCTAATFLRPSALHSDDPPGFDGSRAAQIACRDLEGAFCVAVNKPRSCRSSNGTAGGITLGRLTENGRSKP
jgi:hypothetical protein